jgi:hypothetical protein
MKNMADQQSLSGNIQKDYPEVPLTFEDVLTLLNVKKLPFLDEDWLKGLAIEGTEALLKRHPPEWFKRYRKRLIRELKHIADM